MFIVYLFVFNPFVTLQSVPSDATIWDATQSVTSKSLNRNNLKKKQAPLHEQAPVTLRLVPTGVSDVCSSSRHFSLLKAYWLMILHRWELPSDWLFHCCPLLLMLSYRFVGVSHDSFRPHLHLPNKVSVELERWLLESITSPKVIYCTCSLTYVPTWIRRPGKWIYEVVAQGRDLCHKWPSVKVKKKYENGDWYLPVSLVFFFSMCFSVLLELYLRFRILILPFLLWYQIVRHFTGVSVINLHRTTETI